MKPRFALASLALLVALPLAAQQPPGGAGGPAPSAPGGAGGPAPSGGPPAIEALQFSGGPLAELVQLIRESHRGPLNIVLDPDAEVVVLPALTLRSVSVSGALKVAQAAAKGGARVSVQRIREEPGDQEVFVIRVDVPGSRGKEPNAITRGAGGGGTFAGALATPAEPPRPRRLEVISLRPLLGEGRGKEDVGATLKTALTAIEEALQLAGKDEEIPTFKVHGESGLLFVRGSEEQIEMVQKVIHEMTVAGTGDEKDPHATIARLRDEVERLKLDLDVRTRSYEEVLAKLRAENVDRESKAVPKTPAR